MLLDKQTGIVLLNMGGPDSVDAVEPFLYNIFIDPLMIRLPWFMKPLQKFIARRIVKKRGHEARENYVLIGGESPLLRITRAQANGVAARLGCEGYAAMRYWHPFAAETVELMRSEGMKRAVVLSGYPQHSRSTNESSVLDFVDAWCAAGLPRSELLIVESWPEHPGYVSAVAATVRETLRLMPKAGAHLLFSAHGLPERYIRQGDRYKRDIESTLRLVLDEVKPEIPWSLSFQSKVGPEKWLGPSTPEELKRLSGLGVRHLAIAPLGFISDHIETLQEIDQQFAGIARGFGMMFYRVPSLNDREDFLDALAVLIRERAHVGPVEMASR